MKTQQKGFTLIELMIVIAIIGILASVALPAYREYIVTSKVGTIFQTVKGLQNSIDKTYIKKGGIVFTDIKYNCNDKECYQRYLGQPDVPLVPGNLLSLEIKGTAVGTGTCSSAPWIGTIGAAATAGAIVMTHPAAGADNLIDENLAGAVFTFHPAVTAAGVQWTLNTSLAGTLDTAGKEMETIVCKFLHEDINHNG